MEILIKRLQENAIMPGFVTISDPGMSLFSAVEITLPAGEKTAVSTGVAMAIPVGYIGLIWQSENLHAGHEVEITPKIIDSGSRQELKIELKNNSDTPITIHIGDCIAQVLIQKTEQPNLIEAEELSGLIEEGA